MKKLIFLALLFASCARELQDDCVIDAVEMEYTVQAKARMDKIHVWTKIIAVHFIGHPKGHAFCLYQPHRNILAWSQTTGTIELWTDSHELEQLTGMLTAATLEPIDSSHFIE